MVIEQAIHLNIPGRDARAEQFEKRWELAGSQKGKKCLYKSSVLFKLDSGLPGP
ncbi:MAG: hypothetical protein ACPGYT_03380 [Nitrospirales bacterium]